MKTDDSYDDIILCRNMVFIGQKEKQIIKSAKPGDEVVTEFLNNVLTEYKTCGQYAQLKLPLQNTKPGMKIKRDMYHQLLG